MSFSIKTIRNVIFVSLSLLLLGIGLLLYFIRANQENVSRTEQRRNELFQLADELRQSQDDLGRMARSYIETRDPRFEQYFQEILAIRKGELPRPENYNRTYWDVVIGSGEEPVRRGTPMSFAERLSQKELTEEEVESFQAALDASQKLTTLEQEAIFASQGWFSDENGEFTEQREPDMERARELLFGQQYYSTRAAAMTPLNEFLDLVDDRTRSELESYRLTGDTYTTYALLLISATLIAAIYSAVILNRRVLNPVEDLLKGTRRIEEYLRGNTREMTSQFLYPIKIRSSDEFGKLGAAFNQLTEKLHTYFFQQQKIEQELRQSEERFKLATEAASEGLWDWDVTTGIVHRSPGYYTMLGYEPEELPSTLNTFFDLVHPDDRQRIEHITESYLLHAGDYQEFELRLQKKDGNYVWILSRGSVVARDESNHPLRVVGTHVDITEIKIAEAQLQRREQRFRRLVEGLKDEYFFFSCTRDGTITYISPSVKNILGFSEDECLTQYSKFLTENPLNESVLNRTADRKPGASPLYEVEVYHANREPRLLEIMTFGMIEIDGSETGVEGIARDVTRQRLAQKELVDAREAADAANIAKSHFLSNMSHELRTPLNGVLGYVQILLRDPNITPEQRDSLKGIESCGEHLLLLINDVLDLSKIESGKLELSLAPCHLHKIIEVTCDIVRQKAQAKGLKWVMNITPDVPRNVLTDATKLRQVMVNLLENAVKYTLQGEVRLEVAMAAADSLQLDICDTGIGMTEEDLEQIFEPFQQQEGGKQAGGTGLGLTITKRLVETLGGELLVKSEKEVGSCFTVVLPIQILGQDDLVEEQQDQLVDHRDPILPPGEEYQVLVVDDNRDNRHILTKILDRIGFQIIEAENGQDALDKFQHYPIDLVLMDVRMPVMDGLEATRQIRLHETKSHVPVIAVSASVFPHLRKRVMDAGCDDLVGKPVRMRELVCAIERHLGLVLAERLPASVPVESKPESVLSEVLEQEPEQAKKIGQQLLQLVEDGNLSKLNQFGTELKSQTGCLAALGQDICQKARMVKFHDLKTLAHQLLAPSSITGTDS